MRHASAFLGGWLFVASSTPLAGCRVHYDPEADCSGLVADAVFAFGGNCFTRHDLARTATAADTTCADTGATLAAYATETESNEVADGLELREPTLIGLVFGVNGWGWMNGEPALFASWADGEPNGPVDGDTALQLPDGRWSHTRGATPHPFICLHRVVPGPALILGGKMFTIGVRKQSFDVAVAECENLGGHLATIQDVQQHLDLEELNRFEPWLGLRRSGPVWGWITGEPLEAEHWGDGEPAVSSTNEECAYYGPTGWASDVCRTFRHYLCEIE